ncbi:hypothetical protein MTQ01_23485 [Streptomyces sp. XM4193]|uniref:hypothetical protein n=1 Tax=Streptomyces sp. XM4193 TaxID=2929782 RepID=UPI001FF81A3F|nr:hypothetical protein [Streptomyces sp. XM4193]MCK1798935.1 hypothetical protein [Streptomyces sp. XM4193]
MAARAYVNEQQVSCVFCRFDRFDRREIKLNTTGMSFMGLDWANKAATGLVCAQCGYIQMFLDPAIRYEDA